MMSSQAPAGDHAAQSFLALEDAASLRDCQVVLLSVDDLKQSVERLLGEALLKAEPLRKGSAAKVATKTSAKARAGSSTNTLAGFENLDLATISSAVVDKISATALANMRQDPVRQTVADVLQHICARSVAGHEALVEENIKNLTEAFTIINRNRNPSLISRQALEEENARQRARFLAIEPSFTGPEVAALAGHTADNPSATASRWKKAGKIFSVMSDSERFPAFQFAEGRPLPVIAKLLEILRPKRSDWQIAFWMVSPNASLEGMRPVDRLDDPAVVALAERERDLLIG